jgi:hypothetical protein
MEISMAIVTKKTDAYNLGQMVKFANSGLSSGSYGTRIFSGSAGGVVSWTRPSMFGGIETTAVNAGDTVAFANATAASNSLSSSYASQAYTISTSDASYNAVSQITSGSVPLDLGTVNFSGSFGSTYSVPTGPLTQHYFIATVSGVTFKLAAGALNGGGGGGFGGGGFGGGGM